MKKACNTAIAGAAMTMSQSVRLLTLLLALLLVGCSVILPVVSRPTIQAQDRDDLRKGNLLSIRDRYEQRGIDNLNPAELALLCDVYIKHLSISEASACLDTIAARPDGNAAMDRIQAKQALIAYLIGQYDRAVVLTGNLTNDGARYIRALASIKLNSPQTAFATAQQWAHAFDPEQVYLAANLYLASGHYKDALTVLQDPERRVARDYSLTGGQSAFGGKIRPAPLRVDLFDEFGFGLLDTYSYAPNANVYVEFILAKSELELGNKDSARSRFDAILSYPNIDAYREVHWRALFERARIAEMDGNSAQAIDYYKLAIKLIEQVRASISTEAGRIGFVGDKQAIYGRLVHLLVATGNTRTAFAYTERARSRALVDVLVTQRRFGGHAAEMTGLQNVLLDFERAESRVLELEGGTRSAVLKRSAKVHQAKKQQLLRQAPWLKGLVAVDAKTKLEDVLPYVSADETLLCYFKAETIWYVFILNPKSSPPIQSRPLDLNNIDRMIGTLRRSLEGAKGDTISTAQELYKRLIRPAAKLLKNNLTIIPYGELHYLPFAALYSGSNFLIETHTLRILPSAEVLMILSSTKRPTGSMLILGNPSGDLKGSEREVRRVAAAHQPSEVLLGSDASRANFQRLAPQFDILHIAAHGQYIQDAPLDSRLMLAPSEGESGDLTVSDLYAMQPPLQASIAVLSACESALSSIATGDELIGLQRGFLFAGAESIIGSLWRISDDATAYLMEHFYTSLKQNVSRAKALKEAQIKTLERYPDHGDWAAFTYTGGVQ